MPKVTDDINSDEDEVEVSKKKGKLKDIWRKITKKLRIGWYWMRLRREGGRGCIQCILYNVYYTIIHIGYWSALKMTKGGVPIIKMEIKMVLAMKGGGSRVPHTYSENDFVENHFRIIP